MKDYGYGTLNIPSDWVDLLIGFVRLIPFSLLFFVTLRDGLPGGEGEGIYSEMSMM